MAKTKMYPLGEKTHKILWYIIGWSLTLFWILVASIVFVGLIFASIWIAPDEPERTAFGAFAMIVWLAGLSLAWWYAWGVTPSVLFKIEQWCLRKQPLDVDSDFPS